MKAITDTLKITHGQREEDGTKLEPEQQPVDRVITTVAPVTLGNAPGEGTPVTMPFRVNVTTEMDAITAAQELSRQCQFCRHWNQQEWYRDRIRYEGTAEGRKFLDEQRALAIEAATSEELSSLQRESADPLLDLNGKCEALSYALNDAIYTHPRAFCPSHGMEGEALPCYFKPLPEAARTVEKIRDRVLNIAAGKE